MHRFVLCIPNEKLYKIYISLYIYNTNTFKNKQKKNKIDFKNEQTQI